MTLIEFMWLLSIALVIHYAFKANDWVTDSLLSSPSSPKTKRTKVADSEEKLRNRVQLNEGKDRLMIENLMEQSDPMAALVDDSHRTFAWFMLPQQIQNIPKLRIPSELTEIIHQYSDCNDIRTLFQILTSPGDRRKVFGFTSYVQMHRYLPSRMAKVAHLKKGLGIRFWDLISGGTGSDPGGEPANGVAFDHQDVFIQQLWFWNTGGRNVRAPNVFNWDAMAKLTHLEELQLGYLGMSISMDDIQKLPKSLKKLNIMGNIWTAPSGDVHLGMLPRGLEEFSAFNCRGMNENLIFDAPHSNLYRLDLRETDLQPQLNAVLRYSKISKMWKPRESCMQ